MTDAEWLACADPTAMLYHLRRADARKLRLFACACCRRVWEDRAGQRLYEALATAERYADARATREELRAAYAAAMKARRPSYVHAVGQAVMAACDLRPAAVHGAARAAEAAYLRLPVRRGRSLQEDAVLAAERAAQADLLRDVLGNPFRPAPNIDPAWLACADGAVSKLARAVYDGRAFDRLPLLADALEDAGCIDTDLLGHLRGPGPHCRGCWALDLLLGLR